MRGQSQQTLATICMRKRLVWNALEVLGRLRRLWYWGSEFDRPVSDHSVSDRSIASQLHDLECLPLPC